MQTFFADRERARLCAVLLFLLLAACAPRLIPSTGGEPRPHYEQSATPHRAYLPLNLNLIPTATPTPTRTATPTHWQPAPNTSWQIQYSGTRDLTFTVQVYNLDLFDTPSEVIDELHTRGIKVMCYFSAGSYEDWRPDAGRFDPVLLGNDLDDWPGEKWLDIRQIALLARVMNARLDLAVQKHCDGVDPDNVDGYANDTGFALTYEDQLNYNRWLAYRAHNRGLAIGLKNDMGQIADLVTHFDWALNEQCFQYEECDLLVPFIEHGKPVFGVEYQTDPTQVCPAANAMNFDVLFKNLELDAWRLSCR